MTRRRVLIVAFVPLAAALASGALYALSPLVVTRYHLRRATANEVTLGHHGARTFTGHALAFLERPERLDAAAELERLARDEADSDVAVVHRALFLEIVFSTRTDLPRPWVHDEQLAVAVRCLSSRDALLRERAVACLPTSARLIEAVLRRFEGKPGQDEEIELGRWLVQFWHDHPELVKLEPPPGSESTQVSGPPVTRIFIPGDAEDAARALRPWLERHRRALPPQLGAR